MQKTRIGVLRGGPSAEYEVSLKTGQSVLDALSDDYYDVRDILIDKSGRWHSRGVPQEPIRILEHMDVVFNALHGAYGEDGGVQKFLDTHNIKYTGSNALGSAIAMNKILTKDYLKEGPFRHARFKVIEKDITEDDINELFRTYMQPSVIKPISGGSSVATTLVRTRDDMHRAIKEAFEESDDVMIENYVRGREATVAVADNFRNESLYVFPPIEIVYTKGDFFDYDEKYSDEGAKEICPAPFDRDTTERLMEAARFVHSTLGLRDYSRSDFIIEKNGDIYFLEVNTLPGLTPTSLVPKAVDAVGATLPIFLEHLVEQARNR